MHPSKINLVFFNFIVYCYYLCYHCTYGSQQVECLAIAEIPPVFHDSVLPKTQRDGQFVEHLGHIIKLDTYLPPKQVDNYDTQFTVFNRHSGHHKRAFVFKPKEYCIPESCHGPYQYDLIGMTNSGFNPNLKTIVMLSGFMSGNEIPWMEEAKELWLEIEDVNVILVAWTKTDEILYSSRVAETTLVARQITIFLHYLAELNGRKLVDKSYVKNIHIIGFSLGAHVAAFVGQDLGGNLGRITGLDPAGPSFDMMPRSRRLDPTDAQLVDIIHTNAGTMHYTNLGVSYVAETAHSIMKNVPLIGRLASYFETSYTGEGETAWFGLDAKLGHIDYYANDGRVQPGCFGILHHCDHVRSTQILVDVLANEVQLKRLNMERSSNRMLSFRSDDYKTFINGLAFARKCPALLDGQRLDLQSLERCSVPIDLITSVDKFRSELRYVYKLDLERSMDEQEGFYFTTHLDSNLVGDQYLLKLGLQNSNNWDESCALRVELTMSNGAKSIVEFNKQLPAFQRGNFLGIAMPFVGSSGSRPILEQTTNVSSPGQMEALKQIFPSEMRLLISAASSSGIVEAAKKKIGNILTFGWMGQASPKCNLDFNSLEVIPIMAEQRQVVASYGNPNVNYYGNDNIRISRLADREKLIMDGQRFQLNPTCVPDGVVRRLHTVMVE